MERKELVELLQEHNQEHLLWYYDRLTSEKQGVDSPETARELLKRNHIEL